MVEIGVDGLAGADAGIPPTWLAVVFAVVSRGVVVAAERVADQHGIGFVRVQLTIGLDHQVIARQNLAAAQSQRLVKVQALRRHQANAVLLLIFAHG